MIAGKRKMQLNVLAENLLICLLGHGAVVLFSCLNGQQSTELYWELLDMKRGHGWTESSV